MTDSSHILEFGKLVGPEGILLDPDAMAPFVVDWRQKFHGRARAVLRPSRLEEVQAIIKFACENGISVVPQGGNTGLCGGATPNATGEQVVLSLSRMNAIREVDKDNNTVVVEAGCILSHVHDAAAVAERLFPLSLAAEGSAQIGGLVATNAGGTAVLRYGNMRDLVLGLEVVLPNGQALSSLAGLRKNNTGYDWKQLFVGSEGTLGVVTAACLKLFPRPKAIATVLCCVPDLAASVRLLRMTQDQWGDSVTTFEIASHACLQLVEKHFADLKMPFLAASPYYVLFEITASQGNLDEFPEAVQTSLAHAAEAELIEDATVARNASQARALWRLREEITESERREGRSVKHDVSLPIGEIPRFVAAAEALVAAHLSFGRLHIFGHLGDGSLHVNLLLPKADAGAPSDAQIYGLIHDLVAQHHGSFSAEHGVGQLKASEMLRYKSPAEMALLQAIKNALDPLNIMNPGKLLSGA